MTKALVTVHWPGEDSPACLEHAEKLLQLGKFMGFKLSATPCIDGEICKNCENEEAKQKSSDG